MCRIMNAIHPTNQTKHKVKRVKHAKYEILDCTHFIYLNNVDRITEITDSVLQEGNL